MKGVAVTSVGEFPADLAAVAREWLRAEGYAVSVAPPTSARAESLHARRLLRDLPRGDGRTLALTARDLRVGFGVPVLAYSDPRRDAAVVTLPLDPGDPPGLAPARLRKLVRHEFGHLDGLPHCESPRCVMRLVSTCADLDDLDEEFCSKCGGGQTTAEHAEGAEENRSPTGGWPGACDSRQTDTGETAAPVSRCPLSALRSPPPAVRCSTAAGGRS